MITVQFRIVHDSLVTSGDLSAGAAIKHRHVSQWYVGNSYESKLAAMSAVLKEFAPKNATLSDFQNIGLDCNMHGLPIYELEQNGMFQFRFLFSPVQLSESPWKVGINELE